MAITTATIQVRRGLLKDFNPTKLRPGEWAVSVDIETNRQIVYMCFSPGVTKRMGTLEDFEEQIREMTNSILEQYQLELNQIKTGTIKETTQIKNSTLQELNSLIVQNNIILKQYQDEMNELKTSTIEETTQIKNSAVQELNDFIVRFNLTSSQLMAEIETAKNSVSQSETYISVFENELRTLLVPQIQESVLMSQRWAIGIQDDLSSLTDNSKYYSEQAKREYMRAKNEADRAEQYSGIIAPRFQIDFETMELIETTKGSGVVFELNQDKELLMTFTGGEATI